MTNEFNDIPEMPVLTLDPFADDEAKPEVEEIVIQEDITAVTEPDMPVLSEAEKKLVDDFAGKIDISNANLVLKYGAAAQKKVANFSESALNNVRTKDLGEVGEMLTGLIGDLKTMSPEDDQKGFLGFFKKNAAKATALKAKYDKAEVNIDKVCSELEKHQVTLMKDIAMLDKMYDMNLSYSKELTMYIAAGKKKLREIKENTIPAMKQKALKSGLTEDAQAANDMASLCDRFEKKIHDLELTRMISMQMAPQIRLVQNSNNLMAEKIQSTIVNTIPLWKNQMVLAMGMSHLQKAMEAQRSVSDMTNELLLKNAETLKMGTVETAKESERGIVDIETLKKTNQSLISTLDEVMKIHETGRVKRREAEIELVKIEGELKNKLLEIRG